MFTGIVETVGTLSEIKPMATGHRVRIRTGLAGELAPGDSLAVNGVCLTVIVGEGGEVQADIGPETARVTTLGGLHPGQAVNLERAMRADARLGGHFVLGHVDGLGTIDEIRPEAESHWITVSFPSQLARYFVRKGSVAVDGISLTVANLSQASFDNAMELLVRSGRDAVHTMMMMVPQAWEKYPDLDPAVKAFW